MQEWFYDKDGMRTGPVSEEQLRGLILSGELSELTPVCRERAGFGQAANTMINLGQGGQAVQNPYGAPQPQMQQMAYPPVAPPADGLAIASMVCGIIAVITCYFGAILGTIAVVLGHVSISKIKKSGNTVGGKGMAIAGLVCGYVGIAMTLVFAIFLFTAGAEMKSAMEQAVDQMEQEQKRQERQRELRELIPDQE